MTINTWDASNKLGATTLGTLSNTNHTSSVTSSLNATTDDLGTAGKYYVEMLISTYSFHSCGVANTSYIGNATGNSNVRGFYGNGGNGVVLCTSSTGSPDGNGPTSVNDYAVIAVDSAAKKVWLGRIRSGTRVWIGSGDPAAGTSPTFSASGGGGVVSTDLTTLSGWYFFHSTGGGTDVAVINCGDSAFNVAAPTGFTGFKFEQPQSYMNPRKRAYLRR